MNKKDYENRLDEIRHEILRLDESIQAAVCRRQDLSKAVFKAKHKMGKAIYDPKQEIRKLISLKEQVPESCFTAAKAVQETLMRLSREEQYRLALEETLNWEPGESIASAAKAMPDFKVVAVHGNRTSYAGEAARQLFPQAGLMPTNSFEAACCLVVEGVVEVCVLPLENSTAGTVDDVYALLEKHNLYIIATKSIEIKHSLMGLPGTSLADLRKVISHPQALAQCSTMIKSMGWKSEEISNTAFAAERVAHLGDRTVGAIASEKACVQYGLELISRDINNTARNQTRFVAVAGKPVISEEANRLSLIVRLSHQAGSLAKMLAVLSDLDLNLSKIQSLPIPEIPWEYSFYIDVDSKPCPAALQALYQLRQEQSSLKFLGWYPA